MKKLRKRIFAAVLAALMMVTAMPATALYALAETVSDNAIGQAGTEGTEETVDGDTEEPGTDDAGETVDGDTEEPAQEPPAGPLEEDSVKCICETPCTQDSINGDCPVCGADGASLLDCKGKVSEENTENQEDTGICKHHQEHDADCGYIPKSENGEGSPCTYECRICPIEALIAALPEQVTEDNADDVRARLDEILDLYRELTEDEQGQLDLSRCYELQEALDAANAPMTADGRTEQQDTDEASVTINGETLYYATLEEAFAAADGQTATITMLKAAECIRGGSTNRLLDISSGKVALDMNGKTLSGKGYGDKGIIDISGGSLSIHGEGAFTVIGTVTAISCNNNGILIISETTFNFTHDSFYPMSGIANNGGTVIINSGIFSGEVQSTYGQILHKSGNTTINYAETTGTTTGHPVGVHYKSGALTISGGTFSNITVEVSGEIKNVAELLGKGYTYKKQGGTWATADEMAGLEISNVTVEKIPLTINPNDDTSWYYSTQQTHTLAMNAAPVSGGTVTYVWKNGEETLDCTSDAYTVPAGMTVGSYTYTCEATCDGYTLSHTFTFKIEKSGTEFTGGIKTYNGSEETTSFTAGDTIKVVAAPTPTGAASTNSAMFAASFTEPGAGQMAVFVNDTQVSAPVDAADGTYTMEVSAADVLLAAGGPGTEIPLTARFTANDNMADAAGTVKVNISAVARVEKDSTTTYVGALGDAFTDGNSGATVTLLAEVELTNCIQIRSGQFTLDLNGHTVKCINSTAILLGDSRVGLTIRGSGSVQSEVGNAVEIAYGTLTLEGGAFSSERYSGVWARATSGALNVNSADVTINGLSITNANTDISLAAGTYTGEPAIEISRVSKTLDRLLADGCAFYNGDTPIPLQPDGKTLTGTVMVKECNHTGEGVCTYTHNENASTHTKTCLACGYTETGDCGFEKTADPTADNHTGQCPLCKRDQSGAHSFSAWSGDPVARTCTVCGYEQTAVAKVEKSNGGGAEYMTAKGLNTVFAYNSGYEDATVTLLDDLTNTDYENRPQINIRCTLNLNGHTLRSDLSSVPTLEVSGNGNVTIAGSGEIVSSKDAALFVLGTAVLEGGIFRSGGTYHGAVELINSNLSVTGENVVMENTGSGNGLLIYNLGSVRLSAGRYSGAAGAISVSADAFTLSSLLNQEGTSRVAYYKDNTTLVTEGLDGQTLPSGSYTVKACTHAYQYTHTTGATTHSQTCPACGDAKAAETCSYDAVTGRCACGSTLAVTLPADLALTYDGTAKTPAVTVTVDGTELAAEKYQINYDNNINAGNTAKVTVTAANGSFSGSVSTTFSISKASLTIKANDQTITYGGSITQGTGQVTSEGLCTGDTLESVTLKASTANVPGGNITPSSAVIKRGGEDVTANYNITYQPGTLAISYMNAPGLQYNGSDKKEYYNRDVAVTAVPADSHTYTVSDTLGRDYKASYTISAQEGAVTKTLYFKDAAGHMSDGVEVTVKFDLTPPTGEIAAGAKWWQNVLHFLSFGNYAAKEYTVSIKAEDKNGSGVSKIEYAIVTGADQYTDAGALEAAGLSWTEYDSSNKPTVDANTGRYVAYARLTDNVGNVTYISTDGILLDNTPPTVGSLTVPEDTRKDVTAGVTFTVSEAADYYYVVLPEGSAAPSAGDIIVTCGGTLPEGGTGTAIAGTFPKGSGAVSADTPGASVDVKNLQPYTAYSVYVTAVDRAVDITNSAEGTPAGNTGNVAQADFTTKKTLPVITKNPVISGTYGQTAGEMTLTGGAATDAKGTAVTGTWEVGSADRDKKPSAGTAEKVTVTFTPDSDSFDGVSVEITPAVGRRNLNADGVTVSEVAGTYTYTGSGIKPPVEVNTGTPASGIYISDTGADLTANDFTVSYSNHKDAGTASITITGKGNYTGSVTRNFTIGKAPGREVPDVSGSYTDNGQTYTYTVTPTEGAVYRMGNDGEWQAENIFKDIKPGTRVTFYAKMPETGNYEEGMPKSVTVDFPKLTPAAPALSYKADRTNPADVKVTITPVSGAEYSFDGGTTWTESNEQDGFTTSQTVTLAIRLKGTDTHNPSPAQTVTVNLAKKDREAPPPFSLEALANGETDYTVTIPATEGCEYSFDGEHWSDVHVKTGVNVGESVTGYKRYKETDEYNTSSAVSDTKTMEKFTVKTPVITPEGGSFEGSVSVTITCGSPGAEIYYTTDGSTPGRSSTRYMGAFTVAVPATVKAVAIKDGLNDSAVATASYTKKDGDGSGGNSGGNGGNGTPAEGSGQPFIKGEDGKAGWDVIRAEEEQAEEGSAIHVDMNGSAVVPGDIFDSIKGKDITITFDMGGGILWSVDGKSISADKAGDIDFSVKTGVHAIPVDIVNRVTGGRYSIQMSLAHEGEFGFTAVLSLGLGRENAGYTASLYYYRKSAGELEFICADKVAEDGTVSLAFTHASDYVIAIDGEKESGGATEPAQPETPGGNNAVAAESPKTGQAWRPWWLIVAGTLVILMGIGVFFVVKKKGDED